MSKPKMRRPKNSHRSLGLRGSIGWLFHVSNMLSPLIFQTFGYKFAKLVLKGLKVQISNDILQNNVIQLVDMVIGVKILRILVVK